MARSIVARLKSLLGFASPVASTQQQLPMNILGNFWQRGYDLTTLGGVPAIRTACIDAYAQTMASMEMQLWLEGDDGGYTEIRSGPVASILRKPNTYQTRSDFILNLIWSLYEWGNGYAVIERAGAKPVGLHLVQGNRAQPYIEADTHAVFYAVAANPLMPDMATYLVPQRDVLHVRLHCPNHPLIGVSPIEAAALAMSANVAITQHQAAFFQRMARPSGILSTDEKLTREQIKMLRDAWNAQASGLNAGGVPILGSGLKWQGMSISSQDSEIAAAFNMTIEDVARAFRVPLPLIGSPTGATYNNVEQLIALWMSTGLGFVLQHVESAFDMALEIERPQEIEFDTDSLQRIDLKGRVEALTKGISGGLFSPDEARNREGLPRVAFGSEPRLQAQVVPLSQVGMTPAPSATPAPSTPPDGEEPPSSDEAKAEIIDIFRSRSANG